MEPWAPGTRAPVLHLDNPGRNGLLSIDDKMLIDYHFKSVSAQFSSLFATKKS
jgi:hypothetical protein